MNRIAYGVVGALTAAAATGAALGGVAVAHRRRSGRTGSPEQFTELPADRTHTVQTEDGVGLHVAEVGPVDAALTVVFVHGFALSMRSFYYQEVALRQKFGDSIRLVFFDQRGHGRSQSSPPHGATIDQLGRDLFGLLDAVVPSGPMVLIGHSMGGMTVLELARQHPELFHPGSGRFRRKPARVAGIALVCTSAGGLAGVSLGLPALLSRLRGPLAPLLLRSARKQAALVESSRRIGRDVAWVITRRLSFGGADISPDVVDFLNDLISHTTIEAIADFYPSLMNSDVSAGLAELNDSDVVVVGAERDVLTPVEHSRRIVAALPDAEYVELAGVGHVALLEAPEAVDDVLIELIARVAARQ